MAALQILTPKKAGSFRGSTGYEARPGWPLSTYWRGPLQYDAVTLLHARTSILGRITPLVECTWHEDAMLQRYVVAYAVQPRDGHHPPELIDVCGAKERELEYVKRAHSAIRGRLAEFGCSKLDIWDENDIRGGCRLTNARLILTAGGMPSATDRFAIIKALSRFGGTAAAGEIEAACGLGADAWCAILRCVLGGHILLQNPDAPLDAAATILLSGSQSS